MVFKYVYVMCYKIKHIQIWKTGISKDKSRAQGDAIIKSKIWTVPISSIFKKNIGFQWEVAFETLGCLPIFSVFVFFRSNTLLSGTTSYHKSRRVVKN